MSDMVVVYESDEWFWVEKVMDGLREEGFHPELADDAGTAYFNMENKNPGVLGMPQGRMKISVVVPSQEEARARLFLQKSKEQGSSNVDEVTSKLRMPLILSIIATVVTTITLAYFWGEPGSALIFSLMIVLPSAFIVSASEIFAHNIFLKISAVISIIAGIVGGTYCLDIGKYFMHLLLWSIPIDWIVYIYLRSHKFVWRRKKDDPF